VDNSVNAKVCLAYSAGGHYAELKKAIESIVFTNSYHITFDTGHLSNRDGHRRIFLVHPRKKIFRTVVNFLQSFWYLLKERPGIIISTGADVTLGTIIIGKVVFRCKVIFVESAGDLSPTLTGRIAYKFSDLFIIQWPEQQRYYPNAVQSKGLLL
jgi:beta-1,4-N-acetylglucosaminyltransferase